MPRRHSAEERAASFYRAGVKPKPPDGLTPLAAQIWREIIDSKPSDWFDADQLRCLAVHCENRVMLEALTQRLTQEDVGSAKFKTLALAMRPIAWAVDISSQRLRLTVQNTVERTATKLHERGSTASNDGLVGGAARIKRVA